MKVLMTADTVGGVWTYAMELARGLERNGVSVVLATMGARPSADQRSEVSTLRNVDLVESDFKLEWMQHPWDDVDRAADWLLRLEVDHAPDIVHLNGYAHAALPWSAPVLVVGHSCVRSWWTAAKGVGPRQIPGEWDEYTRRVREGLAAANLVVAPTRAMLGALTQHYGPIGEALVIENGRTPPSAAPAPKEDFIFSAGRAWDEAKNLSALARAASSLDWPVVIAGDTASPDGATIEAGQSVRWLGRLAASEVAQWMSRAAVYALPARYEPFGLSALEAALAGCVLVLGDIPSLREVWDDAALYVSPNDDAALTDALNVVCSNRPLRHLLARRATARARELTPERMAAAYAAAYARLSIAHAEAAACAS
jgi:glycogen synthase